MAEAALTTFASVAILGFVHSTIDFIKTVLLTERQTGRLQLHPLLQTHGPQQNGKTPSRPATPSSNLPRLQSAATPPIPMSTTRASSLTTGSFATSKALLTPLCTATPKASTSFSSAKRAPANPACSSTPWPRSTGKAVRCSTPHADPEIFRIRLGKALDFEFHEDNIGSLFSIRGPRDASALLDVERAFNKLEKVALKRRAAVEKPLIIIVNSMHLLRDDEAGRDLLELLQQRAEQWAASNLATVIFNSDDYWIYERLKQYATRMNVIPILDLNKPKALSALASYRLKFHGERTNPAILEQVYDKVGGRLSYLGRVAKAPDMLATAEAICTMEKTWLLNKCWILGAEMDDDVMDQQKYASAAMVLAKALVDLESSMSSTYDPIRGHILPQLPLPQSKANHDARGLYSELRCD